MERRGPGKGKESLPSVVLNFPTRSLCSFQTFLLVKVAEPSENDSLVLPPFLSYSPPGVVAAADLMYANYGTVEDFEELEKRNLSCIGKIVIMRYGKIFRGNKVAFDCQITEPV